MSDSIECVVVLETYHLKIKANALSLCNLQEERIEAARHQIDALGLSEEDLTTAVKKIPFALRDAAAFLKGLRWQVGFEVAAVLIYKNTYITGIIPDLYINNLRCTHAFSNHEAVGTKPSGHRFNTCICHNVHMARIPRQRKILHLSCSVFNPHCPHLSLSRSPLFRFFMPFLIILPSAFLAHLPSAFFVPSRMLMKCSFST